MRIPSAEMFDGLAQTLSVEAGDDARFGTALVGFLRTLARFDTSVIFAYRGDVSPLDLFDTFTPAQYHVHVTLYRPAPYRLDPFFRAAIQRRLGFWRMRELAPDRFFQSEYFRSYYFETGLAEEVGFFAATDPTTVVVLSLMRLKGSGPFSKSEVATLRACAPTVRALLGRHWREVGARFPTVAGTHHDLKPPARAAVRRPLGLTEWQSLGLTGREASIVELVLQGHSSDSIAARLAIAPGTVKVHRRNIYRKLAISSQTELLAIYVERIVAQRAVA